MLLSPLRASNAFNLGYYFATTGTKGSSRAALTLRVISEDSRPSVLAQHEVARAAALALHDDLGKAVEEAAFVAFVRLVAGGIAIAHADDRARGR